MRKSAEQIAQDVLAKFAESFALPPPASSPESNVPGAPPVEFIPEAPNPIAPTAGPTLPSPQELEAIYRNTVTSRALMGTGVGAVAGGAAGGLLTNWNPVGLLAGAAGLGTVGNRIGTSIGEHAALKKLEKQTGIPWTMPGKIPEMK